MWSAPPGPSYGETDDRDGHDRNGNDRHNDHRSRGRPRPTFVLGLCSWSTVRTAVHTTSIRSGWVRVAQPGRTGWVPDVDGGGRYESLASKALARSRDPPTRPMWLGTPGCTGRPQERRRGERRSGFSAPLVLTRFFGREAAFLLGAAIAASTYESGMRA